MCLQQLANSICTSPPSKANHKKRRHAVVSSLSVIHSADRSASLSAVCHYCRCACSCHQGSHHAHRACCRSVRRIGSRAACGLADRLQRIDSVLDLSDCSVHLILRYFRIAEQQLVLRDCLIQRCDRCTAVAAQIKAVRIGDMISSNALTSAFVRAFRRASRSACVAASTASCAAFASS